MMRGAPSRRESTWPLHRTRRQFSQQFKAEAVALIRGSGKSVPQVCRDLDLAESVVRRWLAQADIDDGGREGLTTTQHEELTRLRKEVRVLREEREILKKGSHLLRTRDAMSRFHFVAAEKVNYSVVRLCHVLEVSTSGFYAWQWRQPSQRVRVDAALSERIRSVQANRHRTDGAPRVHAELRATGT